LVVGGGAVAAAGGGERGFANGDRGFVVCDAQPEEGGRCGWQADSPLLREVEAPVPR